MVLCLGEIYTLGFRVQGLGFGVGRFMKSGRGSEICMLALFSLAGTQRTPHEANDTTTFPNRVLKGLYWEPPNREPQEYCRNVPF